MRIILVIIGENNALVQYQSEEWSTRDENYSFHLRFYSLASTLTFEECFLPIHDQLFSPDTPSGIYACA